MIWNSIRQFVSSHLPAITNIVYILIILILSFSVTRYFANAIRRSKASKMNKDHLELIIKLFRYAVFSIVIIWIMAILGVQLSGLLVAGGIAGIVLGFASQSIVGNVISGIFLMIERPFKIGDAVNIENTIGIIENISIISTAIRTFEGLHIRVPNQKIFTSNITNFVSNVARRFEYVVGIRYSDDAEQAITIIKSILEDEIFVLKNPPPSAFVNKLGDNSVEISVRIWGPVSEWFALKQILLWKIKATLEKNGIEIAFPQRVVWLHKEEE